MDENLLTNLVGNHVIDKLSITISNYDVEKWFVNSVLQYSTAKVQVFAIYQTLKDCVLEEYRFSKRAIFWYYCSEY